MSKPIIIRGGRVIDPRNRVDAVRDVRLEDGKVAAVSEKPLPLDGAEEIQAHGLWVTPGFIDLHVHLREPGEEDEGDHPDRDARRRGGRLHRRRGDAQHPPGQRLGAGHASGPAAGGGGGPGAGLPGGRDQQGAPRRGDGGAGRAPGRRLRGGHRRRPAGDEREPDAPGAGVRAPLSASRSSSTRRTSRSPPAGRMHEGPRVDAAGPAAAIPRSAEVVMVARDLVLAGGGRGAAPRRALSSCAARVRPGARGEAAGSAGHRRGRPAPLHPHRRGGARATTPTPR